MISYLMFYYFRCFSIVITVTEIFLCCMKCKCNLTDVVAVLLARNMKRASINIVVSMRSCLLIIAVINQIS